MSTLFLTTACGSSEPTDMSSPAAQDGVTVTSGLLKFSPETARIDAGQTVTWAAADNIAHVLVEGTFKAGNDGLRTEETDNKVFNLELTKEGQRVSHTYEMAGTFTYFCTIHKGMNGSVVVS